MMNLILVVSTTILEQSKEDFPMSYSRVLGVTSCLAWFQLLYYARGFTSIAALVQMIFAVMSDMSAFFILMCIFIVGLAHSLAVYDLAANEVELSAEETSEHFMNTIRDVALLSVLGEFETADYNTVYKATLALIVIVVMSIVMLNLLIAIISETYERVRGLQTSTITKARADLVDEMERTFLNWVPTFAPARINTWLTELMTPSYLIIMSPDDQHKKASGRMTEMSKLRKQMDEQDKQLAGLKVQMLRMQMEMELSQTQTTKQITEQNKEIMEILRSK